MEPIMRGAWWLTWAVVAVGGVQSTPQTSWFAPVGSHPIGIDATPVPLNPDDPSQTAIGDFRFAGGLVLTSPGSDELHGLSDLEITGLDHLVAVGDLGVFLDARIVLDRSGRLRDVTDGRISLLTGEDGAPLPDKEHADAEGLAVLPNGDRLVSFERHDRIWLYPSTGGPPWPAPMPDAVFPLNEGMEGLGVDPDEGPDAYLVGGELSGETWTCRLSQPTCWEGRTVEKPDGFGLVAIKHLPGRRTAYLLRAFDPAVGPSVSLQIFDADGMVARMDLAPPLTIDNFEGVGVVPRASGGVRFYLLSDDNASASQRTLLLAFDWQPR
jgi:hypothetical protein